MRYPWIIAFFSLICLFHTQQICATVSPQVLEDYLGPSKGNQKRKKGMKNIRLSTEGISMGEEDEDSGIKLSPETYLIDDGLDDIEYYYYSPTLARETPPPCIHNISELVFIDNYFSVEQTFYNCISNVLGSTFIPTFWNGSYHGQIPIYTSMIMSSLVQIVEVDSTVELTFDLTMRWKDDRFDMPGVWERIPMGFIDLTTLILQNDSINIWRPSIVFPDATQVDTFAFDFRLNRNNVFYYQVSYHMILVQPEFDFANYPADEQTIDIRFADAEFEIRQLVFVPTAMEFTTLVTGEYGFNANPIWDYLSNSYSSYVDPAYDNSYNVYEIKVVRRAYGVVIRLILPMALLILLGSITFWVSYDHRVDVTITILLSMSALYIVILQNIPLVGYLTNVDRFVFWMYFMLVLITILHQTYATLNEKLDRWPLRLLYLRLIEMSGRIFVLPAVVIYFVIYIPVASNPAFSLSLMSIVIIIAFAIFVREMFGFYANIYEALRNLTQKCNAQDLRVSDVSWCEALVMNIFHFKIFSISKLYISEYLRKHQAFTIKVHKPLHLKNLSSLVSLLEGKFQATEKKHQRNASHTEGGLRMSRILEVNHANNSGADTYDIENSSHGHTDSNQRDHTDNGNNEGVSFPRRKGWELFLKNGNAFTSDAYTEDDFNLVQNTLLHPPSANTNNTGNNNGNVEMEMSTRSNNNNNSTNNHINTNNSTKKKNAAKAALSYSIDSDDES